ncbi:MAG TPA: lipoyl(octanoyl) transferase LipB [Candidatus Acidoferrum sp.]|nr:lipoyl(octanoyl) transferase LipB [Candidatus Acidoferrum sp.]
MNPLLITDLGLIPYTEACALQQRLAAARKAGAMEDVLLLCEHPHVITLGRNAKRENLLVSEHVLRQKGVELHATNRGGDVTYHGPGQIVGYPILNLGAIKRDVGWYVRMLEEAMISVSGDFGLTAFRIPGKTGIWVQGGERTEATEEKLGAIGVHISRWVTTHGFAYNVSTDLRYFDLIVPCGISGHKATSLEKLLSRSISAEDVKPRLTQHFARLFGLEPHAVPRDALLKQLAQAEDSMRITAQ